MCSSCTLAVKAGTEKALLDPERAVFLADLLFRMNDRCFARDYLDLCIQAGFHHQEYTIYYAYAFSHFIEWLWTGRVLMARVSPPRLDECGPFGDHQVEENNLVLSFLPEPFEGRFVGGDTYGPDGQISWSRPIKLSRLTDRGDRALHEHVTVEPRSIPLEVGTLSNYNTHHHLRQSDGVARWPYGCPFITVMVCEPAGEIAALLSRRRQDRGKPRS